MSHTRLFIWLFLSATTNLTIAAFTLVLYFAFIFSFHLVPLHICGFGVFFLFVVFGTFPSVVLLLRTLTGSFIPFPNTNKDVTFSKVDKIPQYLRFFYCLLCFVFMSFCLHPVFSLHGLQAIFKIFSTFFHARVRSGEGVCGSSSSWPSTNRPGRWFSPLPSSLFVSTLANPAMRLP